MGYAFATSPCVACHGLFSYNPMKVPSIRVNGAREPVCPACMALANAKRVANGLPPHAIADDAYEPCDERELA